MPHDDHEIEELDRLLCELPFADEAMDFYELDGFVAALIVCPEMVMPSEWLPIVWGDEDETGFGSLDQAQATIGAVMAHYNRVAKGLAQNPPEYEAILGSDPNSDDTLWEPWINGFEQAMRLRPETWEATLESDDEEVRSAIPMILALHEIDVGTSSLDDAAVDELDEIAPDLIPQMVLALNAWAKGEVFERGAPAPATLVPLRPKVGRNDPCPCGSGRKFKKCCGAATLH